MRGPSEIEASFIAESILCHAARVVHLPQDEIREKNLFPMNKLINVDGTIIPEKEWTIPKLWSELKTTSNYNERKNLIAEFNSQPNNIGRKYRGIACTVVKYAVGASFRSALVNIHADGSIQLTHSGTEMGQGINTKVAQAAAYALSKIISLPEEMKNGKTRTGQSHYYPSAVTNVKAVGVLLNRITIGDTSTEKLPNMGMSGGSTTSEACCGAVMLACDELVARLIPVRDELMELKKPYTWDHIIKAANGSKINLQSSKAWRRGMTKFIQNDDEKKSHKYVCFGVACSEVEIDCLTGESMVRRVDILYDCGKPLNPSIDLGQIEGGFICG